MNSYRESSLEHQNLEKNPQLNKIAKTQYNWNFKPSEISFNPRSSVKDKYSNFTGSLALSGAHQIQQNNMTEGRQTFSTMTATAGTSAF